MADEPEVVTGDVLPVIQPREQHAPALVDVEAISSVAQMLAQSGFFSDAKEMAQAAVKVMAGQELGIPAIQAMTSIYIVKGKVSLGGMLIGTLIRRSGRYTYRIVKHDNEVCEIAFFERDGDSWAEIGRSSFDTGDARVAGLITGEQGSGPWYQHRRNMLFNRAISNGAKWHCPDIFGGPVYVPEELGATIDGNGELVPLSAPEAASTHSDGHLEPEQGQRDEAILLRHALVQVVGGFDEMMKNYAGNEIGAAGLKSLNRGEYRVLLDWMRAKAKEALPDWDQKEPYEKPAEAPAAPEEAQEPTPAPEAPPAPAEVAPAPVLADEVQKVVEQREAEAAVNDYAGGTPADAAPVEPGSTFAEAKDLCASTIGDAGLIQAMTQVGANVPADLDLEPTRSAFLAAINAAINNHSA